MIKKFSLHCIEKVLFFIGIFLLTSEILKQLLLTFVMNNGHYNLWYFPFQLCSLPMYLLVLYPFFHTEPARNTILGFLSTYNLLGGIAVFFDTSGMHYPLLILTVHSYLWHILLIVTGILSGIFLVQNLYQWLLFPVQKILKDSRLAHLHAVCCLLFPVSLCFIFCLSSLPNT